MKIRITFNEASENDMLSLALFDIRRRFPFCKIKRPDKKLGEKYSHAYVEIREPEPPVNVFPD